MARARLLAEIQADADEISISHTSKSQTTVGIGTVSGRAIVAVGSLALRGVEGVQIRLRLRAIAALIKQDASSMPENLLVDLLELQRIGLYSDSVREKAWILIGELLKARQTSGMLDVISQWPDIEQQLFLRQLSVYKLMGWPVDVTPLSPIAEAFDGEGLADSFNTIARRILDTSPNLLHEFIDLGDFFSLQNPDVLHEALNVPLVDDSLAYFFSQWLPRADLYEAFPLYCETIIRFLLTGPQDYVKMVVDYLTTSIRAVVTDHQDAADPDHCIHLSAWSAGPTTHPVIPRLLLLQSLVGSVLSSAVVPLLRDGGLADILYGICSCGFSCGVLYEDYTSTTLMLKACWDILIVFKPEACALITDLYRRDAMILLPTALCPPSPTEWHFMRDRGPWYRVLFHVIFKRKSSNVGMDIPTRKAWIMVLLAMERGHAMRMAQSFKHFSRWLPKPNPNPDSESVPMSFISQLAEFKSTRWQYFPGTTISVSSDPIAPVLDQSLIDLLDARSCKLLDAYSGDAQWSSTSPSLQNTLFSALPGHTRRTLRHRDLQALRTLVSTYVGSSPLQSHRTKYNASQVTSDSLVICFSHVQPNILHEVVKAIVLALQSSSPVPIPPISIEDEVQRQNKLPLPFAYRFLRSNRDAQRLFLDECVLDALEKLLCPSDDVIRHDLEPTVMYILDSFSRYTELWGLLFDNASGCTKLWRHVAQMLAAPAPDTHAEPTEPYQTQPLSANVDTEYLVAAYMDYTVTRADGRVLLVSVCQSFIRVLINPTNPALKRIAVNVLLCCGILTEEQSKPLVDVLRIYCDNLPDVIGAVADYMRDSYDAFTAFVGKSVYYDGPPWNRSPDIDEVLGPVVGFISLLHMVYSCDQSHIALILKKSRIYELARYVTVQQELERQRASKWYSYSVHHPAIRWVDWEFCKCPVFRPEYRASGRLPIASYIFWWTFTRDFPQFEYVQRILVPALPDDRYSSLSVRPWLSRSPTDIALALIGV